TGGDEGTVRVWDATTGDPIGFRIYLLPGRQVAVFDVAGTLAGASEDAWQWLGWNVVLNGQITRLPAETYGPLPPLRPSAQEVSP
ncbi:hypothetical protein, partial [Nostocoides australiense]|uniref:hypothetical protein n=1 Tax=Nostocoides australiense TaxID=99480 RepID=UPI0006616290